MQIDSHVIKNQIVVKIFWVICMDSFLDPIVLFSTWSLLSLIGTIF